MKLSFIFALFLLFQSVQAHAGETLNRIKQAGIVRCGARTTANAFVASDGNGGFKGIDAEVCKIIASAVLGRPEAIQIVPVNRGEGDRLLAENKIDVLLAGNVWSPARDMQSTHATQRPCAIMRARAFAWTANSRSSSKHCGNTIRNTALICGLWLCRPCPAPKNCCT